MRLGINDSWPSPPFHSMLSLISLVWVGQSIGNRSLNCIAIGTSLYCYRQ